jgi:hypothetical protein
MIRTRSGLRGRVEFFGVALAIVMLFPLSVKEANAESFCIPGPGDRPETGVHGGVPGFERQPPDGFQGFWCGARKVGQHALYNRGSFGDLQVIVGDRGHCAYASMRTANSLTNPMHGTVVLDISVASQPQDVDMLLTPAMRRAYSGFEIALRKDRYGLGNRQALGNTMVAALQNGTPFDVYDVSGDCLHPTFMATTNTSSGNHDGWITPDEKIYYGVPFGGQGVHVDPNRIDMHALDLSDRRNPRHLLNWNRLELPPEIYERTINTNNFHDVTSNDDGTRLYLALYGGFTSPGNARGPCSNGLLILDSSEVAAGLPDPKLHFVSWLAWCDQKEDPVFHFFDPDFDDGSTASSHATEYFVVNGKEYVATTDEGPALGGSASGVCNQRTYARFIDISDEKNPRVVSTFKPDVNKPENCEQNIATNTTGGMVHYLNFDDRYNANLVVYAASNQGIRFVDISDVENPREIAYYLKERHISANAAPGNLFANLTTGSTAVTGTDFSRPDPRFDPENCFWYTGWNQGGLVSIELTDPKYNACMRRKVNGGGWIEGGDAKKDKIQLALNAERQDEGFGPLTGKLNLKDQDANVDIRINALTSLGSLRDPCGDVSAREDAVQFEGTGTYNGAPARFRVCVRDNDRPKAKERRKMDDFFLTCLEGCSYSVGGKLGGGNIRVANRPALSMDPPLIDDMPDDL